MRLHGEIRIISEIPVQQIGYAPPSSIISVPVTRPNDRIHDPTSSTPAGEAVNQGGTQGVRDTSSPNVGDTPDSTVRSRKTARLPNGSAPATEVAVDHAAPEGGQKSQRRQER